MFGICRIEYLENIYRFQDSKDPKMHKKLPQFAFYNYKKNKFIYYEDYNDFKSYSNLQNWSKTQLEEAEERVKSEKTKKRNSDKIDADLSRAKRLKKSEGIINDVIDSMKHVTIINQ
jgi:hypothetical protein